MKFLGIGCRYSSSGFTIEQIPEYQGALVSDGVDDYGYVDNFPVLTKEKGYTVCAIRKWLNIDFISSPKVFFYQHVFMTTIMKIRLNGELLLKSKSKNDC